MPVGVPGLPRGAWGAARGTWCRMVAGCHAQKREGGAHAPPHGVVGHAPPAHRAAHRCGRGLDGCALAQQRAGGWARHLRVGGGGREGEGTHGYTTARPAPATRGHVVQACAPRAPTHVQPCTPRTPPHVQPCTPRAPPPIQPCMPRAPTHVQAYVPRVPAAHQQLHAVARGAERGVEAPKLLCRARCAWV